MARRCALTNIALTLPLLPLLASPAFAADPLFLPVQSISIELDPINSSTFQINVHLTEEGRSRFGRFTTEHVGDKIKFLADARAVSPPVRILTPMNGGVVVFKSVPSNEAEQIAQEISKHLAAFAVELIPKQRSIWGRE